MRPTKCSFIFNTCFNEIVKLLYLGEQLVVLLIVIATKTKNFIQALLINIKLPRYPMHKILEQSE